MKKLIALLMLVCIALMPAALAETTITWDEIGGAAVEANGLEGDFYALDDMGLLIWLPNSLNAMEISEEDAAAGRYALYMDQETGAYVAIDAVHVDDMTLDQALENATTNGMTEPEIVNINGIDAVTYADPANNMGAIVLVDTNCNMIIFSFSPIDSDEAKLAYGIIGSSIMGAE